MEVAGTQDILRLHTDTRMLVNQYSSLFTLSGL